MENTGVSCDVCACRHNMAGCKWDLPEIKVTEHCTCSTQEIPHFCKSYEEKYPGQNGQKGLAPWPTGLAAGQALWVFLRQNAKILLAFCGVLSSCCNDVN